MFTVEAVTISNVSYIPGYDMVQQIQFKDRLYRIVAASRHVYKPGEQYLFFPDGTVLPEWLLRKHNLWSNSENRGNLGGESGCVVKPYYFSRDRRYFSSGFITPLENGLLPTPEGYLDPKDPELVDKLGIRFISKGNPYYFKGDIFLHDVSINKNGCADLEYMHPQFEGKWVVYQEYLPGRKFYVSMHMHRSDAHAFGDGHSIYICADNYGKYRFLSNTKYNCRANLFVKVAQKCGLPSALAWTMEHNSSWNQITLGIVLKSNAFGAKNVDNISYKDQLAIVETYINEVPWGYYLSQEDHKKLVRNIGLNVPNDIMEGYYDYDYVYKEANKEGCTGIVVRTPDNYTTAVLYSEHARMRFIHKNS